MVNFLNGFSFFILPVGLGGKRLEFFETQIKKFKGAVAAKGDEADHVIIEDSVSENKEKCLGAFRTHKINLRGGVKYLTTKWLSKCFSDQSYSDIGPFKISWVESELDLGKDKGERDEGNVKGVGAKDVDEDDVPSHSKKPKLDERKFICAQSSTHSKKVLPATNQKIINELQKLADVYKIRQDTWRHYGYEKAIRAISNYDKEIKTFQEASSIRGISEKMAKKIMEVIESGKLSKVDEICHDEKTEVLEKFCKIWGAGPPTAENWYRQGFRTLEDLKNAKLTMQQTIGLKYYDEIQLRMPREEVSKIHEVVEAEMKKINGCLKLEAVGSYRRGKTTCGDVDLMLVNPGFIKDNDILVQLVDKLKAKGYITDDLVYLEEEGKHKRYLGMFKLLGENQINRRIDIFVVPESEYAAALMHYTGSALFNRSIRLLAEKKGMKLTDRGLYTGTIRKGSDTVNVGQLVPTFTEHDIFNALGLDYKPPEERDH